MGSAMATEDSWTKWGTRGLGVITALSSIGLAALFYLVRNTPAPGDISQALRQHPGMYRLSLGHIGDLTIPAFAYLRVPLVLAGSAFLMGTLACWLLRGRRVYLGVALMMVLFLHAARAALVVFDPYLSSRPLATALAAIAEGLMVLPRQRNDGAPLAIGPPLSAREREVLELVSSGMPTKQVARRLALSPNTVKHHMASVFRKLGVKTRAEAIGEAIRRGELTF